MSDGTRTHESLTARRKLPSSGRCGRDHFSVAYRPCCRAVRPLGFGPGDAQYDIRDLGEIWGYDDPATRAAFGVKAIDDRGRILHYAGILENGIVTPLNVLPGLPRANASDFSKTGVVVGSLVQSNYRNGRAAIWGANGIPTLLPAFGPAGTTDTHVQYCSDGGTLSSVALDSNTGGSHRYAMDAQGNILPGLSPDYMVRPAVNGFMSGWAGNNYGVWHPDGRFHAFQEQVVALNSNLVVTITPRGGWTWERVRIRNYAYQLIAEMSSPYAIGATFRINDRDELVWGSKQLVDTDPLNYWSPLTGKINLLPRLQALRPGLVGGGDVKGINNRGQILLQAYDSSLNTDTTFLLTPVPEPATFAALGLGLVFLRNRKKKLT